jgi:hypothetical protein
LTLALGGAEMTMQHLPDEDFDMAKNCVTFLILSHIMNKNVPHPIPRIMLDDEPRLIAYWSFKEFGRLARYATKEGILDLR